MDLRLSARRSAASVSIALIARRIASVRLRALPPRRPASKSAVHLKPSGGGVWTTLYWTPLCSIVNQMGSKIRRVISVITRKAAPSPRIVRVIPSRHPKIKLGDGRDRRMRQAPCDRPRRVFGQGRCRSIGEGHQLLDNGIRQDALGVTGLVDDIAERAQLIGQAGAGQCLGPHFGITRPQLVSSGRTNLITFSGKLPVSNSESCANLEYCVDLFTYNRMQLPAALQRRRLQDSRHGVQSPRSIPVLTTGRWPIAKR